MSGIEYEIHPAANLFPKMPDAEYRKLRDDIAENGLRQRIVLWRDQVIDGRHRYVAIKELGIACGFHFTEIDGDDDPFAYAISANLHRRHLTESQRAMVADKLARLKAGDNQHTKEVVAKATTSQAEAANALNVSRDSVVRARAVREKGTPELAVAVESGEVPVTTAAAFTKAVPDKAEQAEIVKGGKKAVAKAVKERKPRKPKAEPKPDPPKADPRQSKTDPPAAAKPPQDDSAFREFRERFLGSSEQFQSGVLFLFETYQNTVYASSEVVISCFLREQIDQRKRR